MNTAASLSLRTMTDFPSRLPSGRRTPPISVPGDTPPAAVPQQSRRDTDRAGPSPPRRRTVPRVGIAAGAPCAVQGLPHPGEDGGSERVGAEPRSHSSRAGARPRAVPDLPSGLREQGPTPPAAPHAARLHPGASTPAPLTPRAPHLAAAAAAAAALRSRTLQRPPLRRPRPRPRLRSPASRSSSREKSWPAEGPRRPRGARPQRACALRTSARPSPASAMWRRIYDPRWARPRPPGAPPPFQKPILFRGP